MSEQPLTEEQAIRLQQRVQQLRREIEQPPCCCPIFMRNHKGELRDLLAVLVAHGVEVTATV